MTNKICLRKEGVHVSFNYKGEDKILKLPFFSLEELCLLNDLDKKEALELLKTNTELKVINNFTNVYVYFEKSINIKEANNCIMYIYSLEEKEEKMLSSLSKYYGIEEAINIYDNDKYVIIRGFKDTKDMIRMAAKNKLGIDGKALDLLDLRKTFLELVFDYSIKDNWCILTFD